MEDPTKKSEVTKKTWEEFRDSKLLWWTNRMLHLFGWAIVYRFDLDNAKIIEVFPARVKYRGFSRESEEKGFIELTKMLCDTSRELLEEITEREIEIDRMSKADVENLVAIKNKLKKCKKEL